MGAAAARVQKSSTQVDHNIAPSRGEMQREIGKARADMERAPRTGGQPDRPGVFHRFVNWVKSIFTTKSKPNLEQGATAQGNMTATLRADVNDTLSPEVTGEGIPSPETDSTDAPETIINTEPGLYENTDTETAGLEDTPEPNDITNEEIARRLNAAAAAPLSEAAEFSENAGSPKELKVSEESEVPHSAEDKNGTEPTGRVTVGKMAFDTFELEGYTFSTSGTISVLGKEIEWTAYERIHLSSDGEKSLFGSGAIKFNDERLLYNGKAVVVIRDNRSEYFFDEGLYYVQDGIKIDLGRSAEDLDMFTPKEILLLNYKAENDEKAMTGEITISGDGFNGFAEKALADFPKYLFRKNVDPGLRLAVGEDRKLGFSLSDPDCAVSVGIENVAELTGSAPVTVTVLGDGTVTYHLPEKYSVNLLNELYKQDITAAPVELTPGSSVKVSGIDLSYADITLSDTALEVSTEKKSGSISAKALTYKSFTVNDLSGEVGEPGVSASAEQFSFSVGDTVLSGSLEGFEWKPGKLFSVSKFALGADKIAFGDNISVENAGLHFSLDEGVFSLGAEGTFNIGRFKAGGSV